jgi:hypothetical protein
VEGYTGIPATESLGSREGSSCASRDTADPAEEEGTGVLEGNEDGPEQTDLSARVEVPQNVHPKDNEDEKKDVRRRYGNG